MDENDIIDGYDLDDEMFEIESGAESLNHYKDFDIFYKGKNNYSLYRAKGHEVEASKIDSGISLFIMETERVNAFKDWIYKNMMEMVELIDTDPESARNRLLEAVRLLFVKPVPDLIEYTSEILDILIDLYENRSGITGKLMFSNVEKYSFVYHSINVMLFGIDLAKQIGMGTYDMKIYGQIGLLHDIGYTEIPESILQKPESLSNKELKLIRSHTRLGMKILKDCKIHERVAIVAWEHHERMNGTGYPREKMAAELCLHSRTMALIDTYEALTSPRPHRERLKPLQALAVLKEQVNKGKFDEILFNQFTKIFIGMRF